MTEPEESALLKLIASQQEVTASNLALAEAIHALAAAVTEQNLGASDEPPERETYLSGSPL